MNAKTLNRLNSWENFGVCILLQIILPLLPILLEHCFTKEIQTTSLFISASLYSVAIGTSSKRIFIFSLSLVVLVTLAISYSFLMNDKTDDSTYSQITIGLISILLLFYLFERFTIHVINKSPFFNFN